MIEPKIAVFVLDNDPDTLELIKTDFEEAGIRNYELFTSEIEFLSRFNENVHVAVIDHYLDGSDGKYEVGYDVMDAIFEKNREFNSPIRCKVIVISGQQNPKMIQYYLNNGAFRYIDKNDKQFKELLIEFVQAAIEEVMDFFAAYNRILPLKNLIAKR